MNKKAHPLISRDPVTGKPLQVTRLESFESGIKIEGVFNLSKFNYLTNEQLYFVEVFIKNSGSIKQVEKELNVSYPTVKKMLDEVIVALGYNVNEEVEEIKKPNLRMKVLKEVEKGIITVDEAIEKLKEKL